MRVLLSPPILLLIWWATGPLVALGLVAVAVILVSRRGHRYARATRWAAVGLLAAVLVAGSVAVALPAAGGSQGTAAGAGRWDGAPLEGTWKLTTLTLQTNALLDDPRQPGLVWAGTSHGAWRSADGGRTWRQDARGLGGAEILALGATPAGDRIVAGSADGVVYLGTRQGDGNVLWQRISHPLGVNHPIFSVALAPDGGHTALAGTFGSLYRGIERGKRWSWQRAARTGDSAVTAIAWAPWSARTVYAAVFGTRPPVLRSQDDGRSWQPDTRGLPLSLPTQALLGLATRPPWLILTTMGDGVWQRSTTGSWHDISAGLPARHGMPLATTHAGGRVLLYTGTMGFGVYGKEGAMAWRRIGQGLNGGDHTVLGLALASGPHPVLLAGTVLGVFRYMPRG